jgi:hypothetical protein
MIIGPEQPIDLAIEDCINSAVYLKRSRFQSFQPFHRYASFITGDQPVPDVPIVQSLCSVQSLAAVQS